jgi:hypothetical protein
MRPWLLGALGIAVGVAILTNLLALLGGEGTPEFVGDGLPAMFMVIAPMVVGFIGQGFRSEERRPRLLLTGPLTPRQLGILMVLLPTCLMALGVSASAIVLGVAHAVLGQVTPTTLIIVGSVFAQMFAIVQLGPLAQESSAAFRQRRRLASTVGWCGFFMSILLLVGCYFISRYQGMIAQAAIAVIVMIMSATLFTGRTDFTK